MYKRVIRPILFLLSPETVHGLIVKALKFASFIPGVKYLCKQIFGIKNCFLETEVCGLRFENPIGMAAGFDKSGDMVTFMPSMGFGFMEVGTIVPKPQSGNPKPRIFRLPKDKALINRMGFPSKGLRHCADILRGKKNKNFIIVGNLGKNSATPNSKAADDYLAVFRALYDSVDFFVVNVSCPNVANLTALQNIESLEEIVKALVNFRRGQNDYRPIMLKIAPMLTFEQIDDVLEVIHRCGIDGVVATNTTTSREGLITPEHKVREIDNGGLSGAPLTKRSIEIVRYIHEKTEGGLPIIGVGGIMTEDDAIEMLRAGASLLSIYTGYIYNGPMFVKQICKRIIKERRNGTLPKAQSS